MSVCVRARSDSFPIIRYSLGALGGSAAAFCALIDIAPAISRNEESKS